MGEASPLIDKIMIHADDERWRMQTAQSGCKKILLTHLFGL